MTMQPQGNKTLIMCGGNALRFGGGISDHYILDITKNTNDTRAKGAFTWQYGNNKYALVAKFNNNTGAQEESLYRELLKQYPLSQHQEMWNGLLKQFIDTQYKRLGSNYLYTLACLQKNTLEPNQKYNELKQHIQNNGLYDTLNQNIYFQLPNGVTVAHLFAPQCNPNGKNGKPLKYGSMYIMYERNLHSNTYGTRIANSYKNIQTNLYQNIVTTKVGAGVYADTPKNQEAAKKAYNEFKESLSKNKSIKITETDAQYNTMANVMPQLFKKPQTTGNYGYRHINAPKQSQYPQYTANNNESKFTEALTKLLRHNATLKSFTAEQINKFFISVHCRGDNYQKTDKEAIFSQEFQQCMKGADINFTTNTNNRSNDGMRSKYALEYAKASGFDLAEVVSKASHNAQKKHVEIHTSQNQYYRY